MASASLPGNSVHPLVPLAAARLRDLSGGWGSSGWHCGSLPRCLRLDWTEPSGSRVRLVAERVCITVNLEDPSIRQLGSSAWDLAFFVCWCWNAWEWCICLVFCWQRGKPGCSLKDLNAGLGFDPLVFVWVFDSVRFQGNIPQYSVQIGIDPLSSLWVFAHAADVGR